MGLLYTSELCLSVGNGLGLLKSDVAFDFLVDSEDLVPIVPGF